QYHWVNAGYASYEDYLARFTSKRRNQLKRERRAPSEQGITLRTVRGDALSSVDPETVYQLYLSTVDKHMWGMRHLKPAFFQRVLEAYSHRVEVVEARREGRVIA